MYVFLALLAHHTMLRRLTDKLRSEKIRILLLQKGMQCNAQCNAAAPGLFPALTKTKKKKKLVFFLKKKQQHTHRIQGRISWMEEGRNRVPVPSIINNRSVLFAVRAQAGGAWMMGGTTIHPNYSREYTWAFAAVKLNGFTNNLASDMPSAEGTGQFACRAICMYIPRMAANRR
jgi:hypothetical protein